MRFRQQLVVLIGTNADYKVAPDDAAAHVAVNHEGQPAEHALLSDILALREELRQLLASLPGQVRGKHPFVDLALGRESHVKRHLVHLAAAQTSIVSYMESGDLDAIDTVVEAGFPILRRIARNAAERNIRHQVVFGFSYRSAPRLLAFLRTHKAEIRHLTGVRYAGELGHPFHVADDETVVLPLDHPFLSEGRFASLLVRDNDLARSLVEGFEKLWRKAMRSLQEINVDPRRASE